MKFIKRTNKPTSTQKWYGNNNPFSGGKYDMFKNNGNCTHYCYSRMSEILGKKSNLPSSNAGGWLKKVNGYKTGLTPKLGAIAVWFQKGSLTNQGHVACVEEVKSNGDILTTNSGWKSSLFYKKTYYAKDNYNYTNGKGKKMIFQGFIYCGLEFENETPVVKYNLKRTLYCQIKNGKAVIKGDDVKELQKMLKIKIDGSFGKATEKAVKSYQKANKLTVDGRVGPEVCKSLGWTYKK